MSNSATAVDIDHHDIEVDALIKQWASDNTEKIVKHYAQKGGWEGWAQCEIASTLTDHFRALPQGDTKSVVQREVPVYPPVGKSQKRADVVVQIQGKDGKLVQAVIIELKCEGFYSVDDFVKNVEADIAKVKGTMKDTFKPSWVWVMGFSASEKTYTKMKSLYPKGHSFQVYPLAGGKDVQLHPDEKALNPKIVLWIFEHEKRVPGDAGSAPQSQSQSSNSAGPSFTQVAGGVGAHIALQALTMHS